jgi:beta-glucanase (GH16 family)
MKTQLFALSALLLLSAPAHVRGQNPTSGYKLVWEDTFEGNTLNTACWRAETSGSGGGNNELQYYLPRNVSVGIEPVSGASCMILTARREAFGGKQITSARVNTSGTKMFKHGMLQARIRMPRTANGLWPAFWLLGKDVETEGWPRCGEIDIVELGGKAGISQGQQDRFLTAACHWGEKQPPGHDNYGLHQAAPYSLQDDFHLYTLIWDNDYVRMYLDIDRNPNQSPYYEMYIRKESGQASNHPANYLHRQMYIILNLAVGGNFPEIYTPADITALNAGNNNEAKMYVDYIQLYQKGTPDANEELTDHTESVKPDAQYSLIPNPATEHVAIHGPHIPQHISIYDYSGRCHAIYEQTNHIDLTNLTPGNYILRIETPSHNSESLKLVKK